MHFVVGRNECFGRSVCCIWWERVVWKYVLLLAELCMLLAHVSIVIS